MSASPLDSFQQLFDDHRYVALKQHLYNYRLRKRAVENSLSRDQPDLILEVGSGVSPVVTRAARVVHSELSVAALHTLRRLQGGGWYVAADGTRLPFKSGVFTHVVCSEVLEHVADDQAVLQETARVLAPAGRLVVTFPHRKCYFANDDRFVRHLRRYELSEMEHQLTIAGLQPVVIQKVLGPLEKITMCGVVFCVSLMKRYWPGRNGAPRHARVMDVLTFLFKWSNRCYAGVVWLDARCMPRALAATLLMKAEKPDGTPAHMR